MNLNEPRELASLLEAFMLASGKPQSLERFYELFEEAERPEPAVFKKALTLLGKSCEGRAFELQEVASGYRLQVRERYAPWVGRLWEERPQRYSRAMLETLALIAYRQPITRGEIEDIRGVAVNSQIIKTLQEREWIRVVGHRDVPGRPAMLATTKAFLDHFNLKGLDDLPTLAALRELEPEPLLAFDEDLPVPAGLQARADAELGADGEPLPAEPRDETSFRSLLAELDGMEQGLKTDFDDLLELPEVPEPAALEAVLPAPVADLVALESAPELDADAEEEAALARAIAAEALERMRD
ncbi:MAG: SMC-Scp complex subunit ScpB [Pseudomonadales bacterium]|nr:SMC-Scp complex subunit ScpB [Pseudomonadales bacterium]